MTSGRTWSALPSLYSGKRHDHRQRQSARYVGSMHVALDTKRATPFETIERSPRQFCFGANLFLGCQIPKQTYLSSMYSAKSCREPSRPIIHQTE